MVGHSTLGVLATDVADQTGIDASSVDALLVPLALGVGRTISPPAAPDDVPLVSSGAETHGLVLAHLTPGVGPAQVTVSSAGISTLAIQTSLVGRTIQIRAASWRAGSVHTLHSVLAILRPLATLLAEAGVADLAAGAVLLALALVQAEPVVAALSSLAAPVAAGAAQVVAPAS